MAEAAFATMILYHMPHNAVHGMDLACCFKGLKSMVASLKTKTKSYFHCSGSLRSSSLLIHTYQLIVLLL